MITSIAIVMYRFVYNYRKLSQSPAKSIYIINKLKLTTANKNARPSGLNMISNLVFNNEKVMLIWQTMIRMHSLRLAIILVMGPADK